MDWNSYPSEGAAVWLALVPLRLEDELHGLKRSPKTLKKDINWLLLAYLKDVRRLIPWVLENCNLDSTAATEWNCFECERRKLCESCRTRTRNKRKEGRPFALGLPYNLQPCSGRGRLRSQVAKHNSTLQSQACWHHIVVKKKASWRLRDSSLTGTSVERRGTLKYFVLLYFYLYPI